jgi:hypothetical protein
VQQVNYTIKIVITKDEYKRYLETEGTVVVYGGHARYGRGPCFGLTNNPGEDWENGTNKKKYGIFRMGYPYIAVPLEEVIKHKYTCNPTRATDEKPPPYDECDPYITGYYKKLKRVTVSELDSDFRSQINPSIKSDDKIWIFERYYDGALTKFVVLNAGWNNTVSAPFDLGATAMTCKAFCHFGCSTFKHNYPILRMKKAWKHVPNDRFAFWTSADAYGDVTHYWLYHMVTYPHRIGYKAETWEKYFKYVVRKTNNDLVNAKRTYIVK